MPPLTRHPQEARYASFVAGELLSNPKVCFGHQGSAECAQCACVTRPLSPQLLSTLLAEEWPAWLRSSHYDRCDWLSAALQALWPSVERSLSRRVQVVAVPSLEALAPGFVRRVRIEDLSLGSCAPRVTGVLCADDPDGSARGVELEVEAQWQCDGHAQLAFDLRPGRRITCGIHDLSVKGVLRLRLGPYSSSLPGFSAVAVCFASPPAVRYRLSGVGALATSIPGFNAYLQQCVADALAAACVWPRRLVLPLPGASPGASARNPPAGVLRVTVHEAVDLSPAELLGLKDVALPGSSAQSTSPYVVLELPECPGGGAVGLQREASQHRRNTLSPRFDGQAFHFVVDDPATQRLRVSVRAWDAQGAGPATGSVMGEATLPLGGLHPGVEDTDAWALTLVVPKSVTVQGVMATYRVPSFGGELQELPAGRIRLGLLYTPFAPDNDGDDQAAAREDDEDEDDDDDDLDDDDNDGDDDDDDGLSVGGARSRHTHAAVRRAAARRARRHLRRVGRSSRGVLFIRVVRGVAMQRANGAPRPGDCYVTLALAGEHRRQVHKTRVVSGSRHPVWNEDFVVHVEDAARAELVLAAFDFSSMDAHVPMGDLRVAVADVVAEQAARAATGDDDGAFERQFRLDGVSAGALHLGFQWRAY